ncbi:hypothetical protein M0Q50_07235 [bacterium]|nr:hypothetical protein [bacterium]
MNTITKKDICELQKFASASIIENVDGVFTMSTKDTNSIYLTILSLNKYLINKLSNISLKNQSNNMYSFETSMFNSFIEKYKSNGFKFADNIKQGQAGNISLAYFSIKHNIKLLNEDMFNIINKVEIKIILTKNDSFYSLDINNIDDWDNFIKNVILEYKPIRLFLKNVSSYESNCFYLKPINAIFNKIFDESIEYFMICNGLIQMKSKEIREIYDIDLTKYISNVSNNNYQVKIINNKIDKIYLIEKTYLYLPFDNDDIYNFDKYSFIKNEFNLIEKNDIFEKIDVLKLYSYKNNNVNTNIDFLTFFFRKELKNIIKNIEKNIKTSKDVILNISDTKIIDTLSIYQPKVFDIVKNKNTKQTIRIKSLFDSNIDVILWDRSYNKYDNKEHQITWYNVIKDGLSFEREKTLSLFFIEDFITILISENHKNIKIELEKPINKKNGGKGFLDLFITSELNDIIYGQVFEFKAIYNYNSKIESESKKQSENYDITNSIIDKYNIKKSYNNYNCNDVTLLNLI